ncbi:MULTISPECIES: DMT family transporter [unclassified Olleya]|jgi:drug/metabolite transporter (DMT)-like permease|uniref:DMT family transporter n=1 Tax=unclassified Olleya TaxID=2615019 RepID=UPI0011ADEB6E|nr:DMT family transporter [Olleya sp. Hel_I_94]TVZ46516.1 threonine/homoserine efflux transporter RhtA [Olleya sp. Hel_I_94]
MTKYESLNNKSMQKKAIFYMTISALGFALLNVLVKQSSHFNVNQVVFFRSIGTLFFTVPFLLKNKINFLGNKKGLLIARGVVGCIAMTLFFMSLNHLSMGSAVSIRYISPIFAAFFAIFLLKEHIKYFQWICFFIAFLGVVILKGFDNNIDTLGLLYALLSAVFTGLVYIIIRKIGSHDHPIVVVNYFMIISAIIGGVLSINHWTNPQGMEWVLLLSLGIFGYFGQLYMTKALQNAEINQVAPLKYIEVVFTMIIGAIWLQEIYTLISLLGIILIILGLTLNIVLKTKLK